MPVEGQSSAGKGLTSLQARLARELVRAHPDRAAAVLDRLRPEDGVHVLTSVPSSQAAAVITCLSPYTAAAVLEALTPDRAAAILEVLELDVASRLLRRLSDARRAAISERLPAPVARDVQALLRFPEDTAGALMDPAGLALPEDFTVREALGRVRELPEQTRYNVYVVDRNQVLVGVLNLRELLVARPQARLAEVMTREPAHLSARADRSVVLGHPGWKKVHAIPVVDEAGHYLGVIRYRTLRQLEAELLGGPGVDGSTSEALGELFAAGAAGILDALMGPVSTRKVGGDGNQE